jgi:tetratricopeptide (TPR) repeat protein
MAAALPPGSGAAGEFTVPIEPSAETESSQRIGRYKILQKLGEGGCGVVYMAEQTEPVRRRVALKVIKLGMDTRQVIARFEAERQALALMDHPNIAKVLDAGTTEVGRPYFVMELVKGIRITDYCDQHHLPTAERLGLFTQVCQAIQHAHQKGIIHRDIKPSNILVTLHDGVPVPKVIDFGIAKATEQVLTDKTVFTAFGQFMGTPAYMSPEQAELSGLDIDTRSDIYALGVLLYELLTGKTPFDARELLQAGLDEMRRRIREEEPMRPSTRLSTMVAADLTEVARQRQSEPGKLTRFIRGDLDWIVMKCLEKDRNRRYETANGLAMDLRRHLRNEPVVACPPSNFYRLRKLVRRNKVAFGAGTAVLLALLAGVGASTWMFLQERTAKQRAFVAETAAKTRAAEAKEAAAQSKAVLGFVVEKILSAARPKGESGGLGKEVTLRDAIDAAESSVSGSFSNRPVIEASIRVSLGRSYSYLGDHAAAIKQGEAAVELFRNALGPNDEETLTSIQNLAVFYNDAGRNVAALSLLKDTLARMEAYRSADITNTLTVMHTLGLAHLNAGKYEEAVPVLEKALKLRITHLGSGHPYTISSMNALAMAYGKLGRTREALPLVEESYHRALTSFGPTDPTTLSSMGNLANAYHRVGRLTDALPLREEVFRQRMILYGSTNPMTLFSMNNLAMNYLDLGRRTEAVPLLENVLQVRRATFEPLHPDTLSSIYNLAKAYRESNRLSEALRLYEEAVSAREKKFGADHQLTLESKAGLALTYRDLGDAFNAVQILEKLVGLDQKKFGLTNRITLQDTISLATSYEVAGRSTETIVLLEQTVLAYRINYGLPDIETQRAMQSLAEAYARARDFGASEKQWRELLAEQSKMASSNNPSLLDSRSGLARVLLELGQPTDAESIMPKAKELTEAAARADWRTASARIVLGRILLAEDKGAQAEPLLLSGYDGLKACETNNPVQAKPRLKEALQSLVQLYELRSNAVQAAAWKQRLAEFNQVH